MKKERVLKARRQIMNKETKIRTALRVLVSFYTAICVWQVAINELSERLGIKWLSIACAILIVVLGLVVDTITTYWNNDYTPEACEGTGYTRQKKAENRGEQIDIPAELMENVGILPDDEDDEGGEDE